MITHSLTTPSRLEKKIKVSTWTLYESKILEKWNLENYIQHKFFFLCERYYTKRSRMITIPAAIFALLTTPGQYLSVLKDSNIIVSLLLGLLGMIAGILSIFTLIFKFAEKSQICAEQGKFHLDLYHVVEKELDKEWHDLSFSQFAEILNFYERFRKDAQQFIPEKLANRCKEIETQILEEKLFTNNMEYNTISKEMEIKQTLNSKSSKNNKNELETKRILLPEFFVSEFENQISVKKTNSIHVISSSSSSSSSSLTTQIQNIDGDSKEIEEDKAKILNISNTLLLAAQKEQSPVSPILTSTLSSTLPFNEHIITVNDETALSSSVSNV